MPERGQLSLVGAPLISDPRRGALPGVSLETPRLTLLPCCAEHLIALIDQPPLHIGTVVDPDDGPV